MAIGEPVKPPETPAGDLEAAWERVGRICSEVARKFSGRLLADEGTYVLVPPGTAGSIIVVQQDDNGAVLSVGPYASVTFEWSEADALNDLRTVIESVQQGDAEVHFGRQGRLLLSAGSWFGPHGGVGGASDAPPPLMLCLPAWK